MKRKAYVEYVVYSQNSWSCVNSVNIKFAMSAFQKFEGWWRNALIAEDPYLVMSKPTMLQNKQILIKLSNKAT